MKALCCSNFFVFSPAAGSKCVSVHAEGVACYKGTPFNTTKGPLTSKITNAPVK